MASFSSSSSSSSQGITLNDAFWRSQGARTHGQLREIARREGKGRTVFARHDLMLRRMEGLRGLGFDPAIFVRKSPGILGYAIDGDNVTGEDENAGSSLRANCSDQPGALRTAEAPRREGRRGVSLAVKVRQMRELLDNGVVATGVGIESGAQASTEVPCSVASEPKESTLAAVVALVHANPPILSSDIPGTIAPRVAALAELLGLCGPPPPTTTTTTKPDAAPSASLAKAAVFLARRAPQLFTRDETALRAKVSALQRLLPGLGAPKVAHMLLKHPSLLAKEVETESRGGGGGVADKIRALRELFPHRELYLTMIAKAPALLSSGVDQWGAERVLRLADLLSIELEDREHWLADRRRRDEEEEEEGEDRRRFPVVRRDFDNAGGEGWTALDGVIGRCPQLLLRNLDDPDESGSGGMVAKLQELQEILPSADVGRLVASAPTITNMDVRRTVTPKVRYLRARIELTRGGAGEGLAAPSPPLESTVGVRDDLDTLLSTTGTLLTFGWGRLGRLEFAAEFAHAEMHGLSQGVGGGGGGSGGRTRGSKRGNGALNGGEGGMLGHRDAMQKRVPLERVVSTLATSLPRYAARFGALYVAYLEEAVAAREALEDRMGEGCSGSRHHLEEDIGAARFVDVPVDARAMSKKGAVLSKSADVNDSKSKKEARSIEEEEAALAYLQDCVRNLERRHGALLEAAWLRFLDSPKA